MGQGRPDRRTFPAPGQARDGSFAETPGRPREAPACPWGDGPGPRHWMRGGHGDRLGQGAGDPGGFPDGHPAAGGGAGHGADGPRLAAGDAAGGSGDHGPGREDLPRCDRGTGARDPGSGGHRKRDSPAGNRPAGDGELCGGGPGQGLRETPALGGGPGGLARPAPAEDGAFPEPGPARTGDGPLVSAVRGSGPGPDGVPDRRGDRDPSPRTDPV